MADCYCRRYAIKTVRKIILLRTVCIFGQFCKLEFAFVGCFGFYAGKPDMEIVRKKPEGFTIMVPQNKEPLVI